MKKERLWLPLILGLVLAFFVFASLPIWPKALSSSGETTQITLWQKWFMKID